jgi:hypothetical protein
VCFSPDVDVAAGVIVGSVGVTVLRHVRRPTELPLASLPLLFGAHQLTEAFVWWGLMGKIATSTGHVALWLYMTFAFVLLPTLAPVAVLLVEPNARRRRAIARFAALGVVVSLVYLDAMVRGPIGATITTRMLSYRTGVAYGPVVAIAYMTATVGALMSSSHRRIARFGAINLVALPLLVLVSAAALTSLWCSWAAVTSVVIARYQRFGDETPAGPAGRSAMPTRKWRQPHTVARVALARIASWSHWARPGARPS